MDLTAHTSHGYSAKQTADIVGITYRQLDYWARTDLVKPSRARATGSGSRRQYSYDDLLRLKVIKRLIDNGIKLEKVRDFFDYVRNELQEDISSANLVIDGANAAIVRSQDELIDALHSFRAIPEAYLEVKETLDTAVLAHEDVEKSPARREFREACEAFGAFVERWQGADGQRQQLLEAVDDSRRLYEQRLEEYEFVVTRSVASQGEDATLVKDFEANRAAFEEADVE